eukprot:g61642.t1
MFFEGFFRILAGALAADLVSLMPRAAAGAAPRQQPAREAKAEQRWVRQEQRARDRHKGSLSNTVYSNFGTPFYYLLTTFTILYVFLFLVRVLGAPNSNMLSPFTVDAIRNFPNSYFLLAGMVLVYFTYLEHSGKTRSSRDKAVSMLRSRQR